MKLFRSRDEAQRNRAGQDGYLTDKTDRIYCGILLNGVSYCTLRSSARSASVGTVFRSPYFWAGVDCFNVAGGSQLKLSQDG